MGGDTSQSDSNAEGPAEAEGTEALLGLVKQCSAVVKPAIASDSVQKIHAQICDVHVDKNAMSIMQVDADHCEEYADQQMTEIGTISMAPSNKFGRTRARACACSRNCGK